MSFFEQKGRDICFLVAQLIETPVAFTRSSEQNMVSILSQFSTGRRIDYIY